MSDVQTAATDVLGAGAIQGATTTVNPTTITKDTTAVTATVTAPMNQNAWIASWFLRDRSFTGTCTLQRERIEAVSVP
jgi:hypothetical protein